MNEQQAEVLKGLMEAGHPDARVTVTAEPGGVRVAISGPGVSPGSSRLGEATLSLTDDSVFLQRYLACHAG